jgi:DcmR-like sensory protein
MPSTDHLPAAARAHAVVFYRSVGSLCTSVTSFLMAGLADDQPALVIARREHLAGIMATLAQALDVHHLQASGLLVMRDARDLLPTLMTHDMPDEGLLEHTVTPILTGLAGPTGRTVRVYGEMVDLLWQQRRRDAALRLEELWNMAAHTHKFSLLCGYAMTSLFHITEVDAICDAHSHVLVDAWDRARA